MRMRKISAVIVDNNNDSILLLNQLLSKHCGQLDVIGAATSIETAFREITEKQPDVIFTEIELNNSSAFDLLRRFESLPFEIIFTSNTTLHAITAFKVNAVDYLLKPFNVEELKTAVQKTIARRPNTEAPESTDEIRIAVHKNDKVEQLNTRQIISLEARNNYTLITTQDGQKHLISKVLRNVEKLLEANHNFIRIHRSVIINTHFIKDYTKAPPYTVTLVNNTPFEISRRKKTEILEILRSI